MTKFKADYQITPDGYWIDFRNGDNSPRVNGHLQLQTNQFYRTVQNGNYPGTVAMSLAPAWVLQPYTVNGRLRPTFAGPRDYLWFEEDIAHEFAILTNRLRASLSDSIVSLGVAFAERNETARMIGSTSRRIASCLQALSRRDVIGAAQALGAAPPKGFGNGKPSRGMLARFYAGGVTNAFLQLQYGWKPLVSDMVDAMIAADKYTTGNGLVRAHLHKSRVLRGEEDVYLDVSVEGVRMSVRANRSWEYRLKVQAAVEVDPSAFTTAVDLGITPVVLWDLIPYSFVVDQFVKIGDWLQAALPLPPGTRITDVFKTVYAKEIWQVYPENSSVHSYVPAVDRSDPQHPKIVQVDLGMSASVTPGNGTLSMVRRQPHSIAFDPSGLGTGYPDEFETVLNDVALATQLLLGLKGK